MSKKIKLPIFFMIYSLGVVSLFGQKYNMSFWRKNTANSPLSLTTVDTLLLSFSYPEEIGFDVLVMESFDSTIVTFHYTELVKHPVTQIKKVMRRVRFETLNDGNHEGMEGNVKLFEKEIWIFKNKWYKYRFVDDSKFTCDWPLPKSFIYERVAVKIK